MQAIKAATVNAAKHFRYEDEWGSIAPGRLADILLVATDLTLYFHYYLKNRIVRQHTGDPT